MTVPRSPNSGAAIVTLSPSMLVTVSPLACTCSEASRIARVGAVSAVS
jgi:hypothetical protein